MKKGSILKFKNYQNKIKDYFVIYADTECFLEKIQAKEKMGGEAYQNKNKLKNKISKMKDDRSKIKNDKPKKECFTKNIQYHDPSGFGYLVVCKDKNLMKPKYVKITKEHKDDNTIEKKL